MILSAFIGGLNTLLSPNLLANSEAVECVNVDITSGALKAVKGPGPGEQTVAPYTYYFSNQWVDVSTQVQQAPSTLNVYYGGLADSIFANWVIGGTATSIFADGIIGGLPTTSAAAPSVVEFNNTLVYTNELGLFKRLGVGKVLICGVTPAVAAPVVTVGTATGQTGVYTYAYTYYRGYDGTESNPSELSAELTLADQKANIAVVASAQEDISAIRIYRIGGNLLTMSLVMEVPNTTATVVDGVTDANVIGDIVPLNNNTPPLGLKYLVERNGVFYAAVGNKLYFTQPLGNPNYWPAFYYIQFAQNITGLASTPNGIVVFTTYATEVVIGSDISTYTRVVISNDQGCPGNGSIVPYGQGALFLSSDGLCFTSGASVELLSYNKLGKTNISASHAVLIDNIYYALTLDAKVFVHNLNLQCYYWLDLPITGLYKGKDTLYCRSESRIAPMFTGDKVPYSYTTGIMTDARYSAVKSYNNVYLRSNGDVNLAISLDPQGEVTSVDLVGNTTHDISVPQVEMLAYGVQFSFSGTGDVYELEYVAEERQNGR